MVRCERSAALAPYVRPPLPPTPTSDEEDLYYEKGQYTSEMLKDLVSEVP